MSLCAAACYSPTPANGAWTCSADTHACPSGYYCADDNTCWKSSSDGGMPPVPCAESTAPLCEDFESDSINPSIWSMSTMNGQLSVDGQHAHRGSFALHAHTGFIGNANLAVAQITATHKLFPMLQAGFYARAFVYLPAPAPAEFDALFYASRGFGNGLDLGFGADNLALHDLDNNHAESSSTSLPLGTWVCLEWSLNGDASRVWLNGNELHDLDYMGPANDPYQSLSFGTSLGNANNQGPTDLWVDDIIVDTSQIGCSQ
jgi:hypothetical protein